MELFVFVLRVRKAAVAYLTTLALYYTILYQQSYLIYMLKSCELVADLLFLLLNWTFVGKKQKKSHQYDMPKKGMPAVTSLKTREDATCSAGVCL